MLAQKPWYHGPLSRGDVEAALAAVTSGQFLIRKSTSGHGYVLSIKWHQRVKHLKMQLSLTECHVSDLGSFGSIAAMIEHYQVST